MNIAFCSSEVAPFAKTGGLADVCGSLPEALVSQGCAVKVFMPWYKDIKPQQNFPAYGYTKEKGVEFYFIRHDQYFWRDGLYGNKVGDYVDNIERFSFLCEKIFEVIKQIEWSPDILHINDWQTSLAGIYLKVKHGANPLFKKTKIALTIHNIAYQGVFLKERFGVLGISWDYFNLHSL